MSIARPSCWAVLAQGNQVSIVAAVEDKLFLLDPFEPQLQVSFEGGEVGENFSRTYVHISVCHHFVIVTFINLTHSLSHNK